MVICCIELLVVELAILVFLLKSKSKKENFHKTTNSNTIAGWLKILCCAALRCMYMKIRKQVVVPSRDKCTWKFANISFIGCWQPFKPWQTHKFQNNYFLIIGSSLIIIKKITGYFVPGLLLGSINGTSMLRRVIWMTEFQR